MDKWRKQAKKWWQMIGPGFITGSSDDDPSGIGTYAQTGAMFGYSQLWTALFSLPFMAVVQEMCGRIGLVTGKGLARVIREQYPRHTLYFVVTLLLVANTINIGADLGAMAASAQLLFKGVPFAFFLIAMTVLILTLEVFVSYRTYANVLKYLSFTLLAYVIVVFWVKQDWINILQSTGIPTIHFNQNYLLNVVAILGTTISPYLFFWQASEEVEEEIAHHKATITAKRPPRITWKDVNRLRWDTVIGMVFSNIIMWFIIITAASAFNFNGITQIETSSQAAEALRPLAGDFTFALFALGIIGTGLLAVPVLAGSASYAIAETFNLREGLFRKLKQAHGFYGVITIATLVGLLINFTSIKPFQLLYYTAILNGLVAPPLLFFIVRISSNKEVMGEYASPRWSTWTGWLIAGVMALIGLLLLISLF